MLEEDLQQIPRSKPTVPTMLGSWISTRVTSLPVTISTRARSPT